MSPSHPGKARLLQVGEAPVMVAGEFLPYPHSWHKTQAHLLPQNCLW